MEARDVLFENEMPGWQYRFKGYDIKIYGAPKFYAGNAEHATQKICIDAKCHYVDVKQAYLAIDYRNFLKPVLLLHVTDLNPFTTHTVSAVAVRKDEDTADPRLMTFHSLTYQTFTSGTPPPKPWLKFDWPGLVYVLTAPRRILPTVIYASLMPIAWLIGYSCAVHVLVGILTVLRTAIQMLQILVAAIIGGVGDLLRMIPRGVACVAAGIRAVILLVHDVTGYLLIALPARLVRSIIGVMRRTTRNDLETGDETEPFPQDMAPLPRPRPPPSYRHPARYSSAGVTFPSSSQTSALASFPISQRPPPDLLTGTNDSWVVATPETRTSSLQSYASCGVGAHSDFHVESDRDWMSSERSTSQPSYSGDQPEILGRENARGTGTQMETGMSLEIIRGRGRGEGGCGVAGVPGSSAS